VSSYLKFQLSGQFYAISVAVVEEILLLPELITIPDAPADVLGLLDYRGKTLPVIHLAKRLGIAQPQCQVTDSLLVINWQGNKLGVVVNQAEDIITTSEDQIDTIPAEIQPPISLFLAGVCRLEDGILPLINPDHIVRAPEEVMALAQFSAAEIEASRLGDFYEKYVADATANDRAKFYERRLAIAQVEQEQQSGESLPFVLVNIGQETIGLPLKQIREFINFVHPTPIPFAPNYVVGDVTLRGEILTLVDISAILGLSAPPIAKSQAVVTEVKQQKIGILIDQVEDVVNINTLSVSQTFADKSGVMGSALLMDKLVQLVEPRQVLAEYL